MTPAHLNHSLCEISLYALRLSSLLSVTLCLSVSSFFSLCPVVRVRMRVCGPVCLPSCRDESKVCVRDCITMMRTPHAAQPRCAPRICTDICAHARTLYTHARPAAQNESPSRSNQSEILFYTGIKCTYCVMCTTGIGLVRCTYKVYIHVRCTIMVRCTSYLYVPCIYKYECTPYLYTVALVYPVELVYKYIVLVHSTRTKVHRTCTFFISGVPGFQRVGRGAGAQTAYC